MFKVPEYPHTSGQSQLNVGPLQSTSESVQQNIPDSPQDVSPPIRRQPMIITGGHENTSSRGKSPPIKKQPKSILKQVGNVRPRGQSHSASRGRKDLPKRGHSLSAMRGQVNTQGGGQSRSASIGHANPSMRGQNAPAPRGHSLPRGGGRGYPPLRGHIAPRGRRPLRQHVSLEPEDDVDAYDEMLADMESLPQWRTADGDPVYLVDDSFCQGWKLLSCSHGQ